MPTVTERERQLAQDLLRQINMRGGNKYYDEDAETIATALADAEARGLERGREECACLAMDDPKRRSLTPTEAPDSGGGVG